MVQTSVQSGETDGSAGTERALELMGIMRGEQQRPVQLACTSPCHGKCPLRAAGTKGSRVICAGVASAVAATAELDVCSPLIAALLNDSLSAWGHTVGLASPAPVIEGLCVVMPSLMLVALSRGLANQAAVEAVTNGLTSLVEASHLPGNIQ